MSTYVISDIHGYKDRFFDLLRQVQFSENDELYVLGDIIDRGPHSPEMLEWAIEEAGKNIHFLMGNHEDMAYKGLKQIQDEKPIDSYIWDDPWSWNGGLITLDCLREDRGCYWCHEAADWIRQLPLYKILDINGMHILLVHAGICTNGVRRLDDFNKTGIDKYVDIERIGEVWSQHILWIRDRWFYDKNSYPFDYIIFGHSPTSYNWQAHINFFDDKYIHIQGKPGDMIHMSGYGNGHMRYCIDTGRERLGILRLDDLEEFYSEIEEELC